MGGWETEKTKRKYKKRQGEPWGGWETEKTKRK